MYKDELQIQSNVNEQCMYVYNKYSHTNKKNECCCESNFNVNRKYNQNYC